MVDWLNRRLEHQHGGKLDQLSLDRESLIDFPTDTASARQRITTTTNCSVADSRVNTRRMVASAANVVMLLIFRSRGHTSTVASLVKAWLWGNTIQDRTSRSEWSWPLATWDTSSSDCVMTSTSDKFASTRTCWRSSVELHLQLQHLISRLVSTRGTDPESTKSKLNCRKVSFEFHTWCLTWF